MLWLTFEARHGAEGQGTSRDDVEGVGGATGSVRVFLMTTEDNRIVCAKLPDGRSIAEPVRAGIVTLYIEYSQLCPAAVP
jgi:hypothetical protein